MVTIILDESMPSLFHPEDGGGVFLCNVGNHFAILILSIFMPSCALFSTLKMEAICSS
jgi:hypothetical protein